MLLQPLSVDPRSMLGQQWRPQWMRDSKLVTQRSYCMFSKKQDRGGRDDEMRAHLQQICNGRTVLNIAATA